jgi:hypothetical protein
MRAWQRVRRIVFSLSSFDGDWQKGQGFSALEVAGAMAKGEGWQRSSRARLVSRSPSFASSYDRAQRSCSGEMRAR